MSTGVLIAIDWGTTNFRAYLLDRQGAVLDKVAAPRGILNVEGGDFPAAFRDLVGHWQTPDGGPPALMAGMIGSRNGWVEVPYVPCPADATLLAGGLMPVPTEDGRPIHLVPGVACLNDGVHDVIRGEETQIIGAIASLDPGAGDAVFCMPGTHSKWVSVRGGKIERFRTAMTGELFSVLKDHSILGRLMAVEAGAPPGPAFEQGLERASQPGGLLHHLFGVRSEVLFEAVTQAADADYLSGILIGHEISGLSAGPTVTLIGSNSLNERYRYALSYYGQDIETLSGDSAVIAGLWLIAQQAGILGEET